MSHRVPLVLVLVHGQRPGLALIAMQDADASSGTTAQHRAAAEAAGAEIAELAGVGHWWPVENPRPAAAALTAFGAVQ